MVLPNPKTTYKALLMDYDALLLASDDECSYCLSEREIQMLLAFVEYIGWKTRYIATETEIDQSLILQWQGNLARKLMSGCCGDEGQLHRFTEGGIYQTSDDGGVTWHDDPENDPRNDAVGAPPLPGEPSDLKRCAAADNVRGLFEQYRDNLIEIVGATPTVLAIIAGILAFIGTILGLSGVGLTLGVIFLTMAAEIISIGGTGISGAITFSVLQDFRCLVYCRMNSDGELTYEAWQGLLVDIAGSFDGFTETFFYQTVMGMGYIGVNNAATMGASTADDCDDCGCTWCYTWLGTDPLGDWDLNLRPDGAQTTYNGTSIVGGATTIGDANIAQTTQTINRTITHIEFTYNWIRTEEAGGENAGGIMFDDVLQVATPPLTGSGSDTLVWDGTMTNQEIKLFGGVFDDTGTFKINKITIMGNGTNPFGADNCP